MSEFLPSPAFAGPSASHIQGRRKGQGHKLARPGAGSFDEVDQLTLSRGSVARSGRPRPVG